MQNQRLIRNQQTVVSQTKVAKPNLYVMMIGLMNAILVGCSVAILFKIYEFKGCAACDSNLDDIGQKGKLRSVFFIAITTLLITVSLLMGVIFSMGSADMNQRLDLLTLVSGILSFILLLFDSVIFGILQYDKALATIRETGAYGNFKIVMGLSIGIRACVFIGLMVMYVLNRKKATVSQVSAPVPTLQMK